MIYQIRIPVVVIDCYELEGDDLSEEALYTLANGSWDEVAALTEGLDPSLLQSELMDADFCGLTLTVHRGGEEINNAD